MYLYEMSDQQLAQRMASYVAATRKLQNDVSDFLDGKSRNQETAEKIRQEYKRLKEAIREDRREVSRKECRHFQEAGRIKNAFVHRITEAAARGFSAKVNAPINQHFFSAVYIALEDLTYSADWEQWTEEP